METEPKLIFAVEKMYYPNTCAGYCLPSVCKYFIPLALEWVHAGLHLPFHTMTFLMLVRQGTKGIAATYRMINNPARSRLSLRSQRFASGEGEFISRWVPIRRATNTMGKNRRLCCPSVRLMWGIDGCQYDRDLIVVGHVGCDAVSTRGR